MADDEWEYEYDDTSTQTVYLTLDLSTHKQSVAGPRFPTSHSKSANAKGKQKDEKPDTDSDSHLQIIDLHGPEPLVAYNDNFYSCHWSSDLGTTIYLASSPVGNSSNPDNAPLRSYNAFDLLGLSSARLVARPATLNPRPQSSSSRDNVNLDDLRHAPDLDISQTKDGDTVYSSQSRGLCIDLAKNATDQRTAQARFIERVTAIKRRRGQTGAVPIVRIKPAKTDIPQDWEMERARHLAAEIERDATVVPEPGSPTPEDDDGADLAEKPPVKKKRPRRKRDDVPPRPKRPDKVANPVGRPRNDASQARSDSMPSAATPDDSHYGEDHQDDDDHQYE